MSAQLGGFIGSGFGLEKRWTFSCEKSSGTTSETHKTQNPREPTLANLLWDCNEEPGTTSTHTHTGTARSHVPVW